MEETHKHYEQSNQGAPDLTPEPESVGGTGIDPDNNTPHNTGIAGPDPGESEPDALAGCL